VVALAALALATGARVARTQTPPQRCAARKLAAAGAEAACLLGLDARAARGSVPSPTANQRCRDRAANAFAQAEARGGCAVVGDAAAVDAAVAGFADALAAALDVGAPNRCQATKLKAAGKATACRLALAARAAAAGTAPDPGAVAACNQKLAAAFAQAEARGGCATLGDAPGVESAVDAFVAPIVADEPTVVTCAAAGCPAPLPCDATAGPCWQPSPDTRWQYQLQATLTPAGTCAFPATAGIDVGIGATPFTGGGVVHPAVYDIDFLTDPACAPGGSIDTDATAAVAAIHAAGARAICYVDAGTDEPFRPDHPAYVAFDQGCGGCLFGKAVSGFREEHWLDIENDQGQRTFVLAQVAARLDRCRADGFDAVEFDNVDAYANDTGLAISAGAQLLFNTALANLAHARGLTAALKNDLGQVPVLLPYFDMAINEQCQQFDECAALDPFLAAGKAVFQVEYHVAPTGFCPAANAAGRNAIVKSVDLFDLPWTPCR